MALLAFDLDIVDHSDIRSGLSNAPSFDRFTDAMRHVIRGIHGIPTLFKNVSLDQIEVYLGRAGATEEHVLGRFTNHREDREHEHGAILFQGATAKVVNWEGWSNRVLKLFENRGVLCVANIVAGKNGRTPSAPTSVVYMTWRKIRRQYLTRPTKNDVAEMAKDLAESTSELRPPSQLARAMDPITRPNSDYADIRWHPEHAK